MIFVGRDREVTIITHSIDKGENVIISGKFGIGRTSLVHHVAEMNKDNWQCVFADFSKPPKTLCLQLTSELLHKADPVGMSGTFRRMRFELSSHAIQISRIPVIVLDNIAKLSDQKLNLIRSLAAQKRFRFIAIIEHFLKEEQLQKLRLRLFPSVLLELGYLKAGESRLLIRDLAVRNRLDLDQATIRSLAVSTGGYPLGICQFVNARFMQKVGRH
jgi:hypothetical protein